jgi:hypothetical protein
VLDPAEPELDDPLLEARGGLDAVEPPDCAALLPCVNPLPFTTLGLAAAAPSRTTITTGCVPG